MPVITDQQLVNTAAAQRHTNAVCISIERVFNKFLERTGRSFNNLTSCNLVNKRIGELPDLTHRARSPA